MKKVLTQFAGNLLSKEQMKVVKGGDTYGGIYNGESDSKGQWCASCRCNGASIGEWTGRYNNFWTINDRVLAYCGNYSNSGSCTVSSC